MSLTPERIREIRVLVSGRIREDVPLSRLCSFRIGGPADLVAEPDRVEQLAKLLPYLTGRGIPFMLLGSGTNILFRDGGFRGVVIRMTALEGFDVMENGSGDARVTAAAGVPLPVVVKRSTRLGWTGLEPLWGIPGSFGGATATNAGAGGVSLGDFLVKVRLLTSEGEELVMGPEDLRADYRSMELPPGTVVVEGTMKLAKGSPETIDEALDKARKSRRASQPLDKPSAGCIFKNPSPEEPAGLLIDRCGLKSESAGDAQVSDVHANFIVNRGNATAADVLALVERIRARVKESEGVDLETEILVMGEER
jgi:UDP-N-acetylmuramate dehydrogenase